MAEIEACFGRYALLKKLAVGGMAEIYLAQRLSFGGFARFVVVKRLLPEHRGVDAYESLFLDEARIAAALEHPNIVSVYDLGKLDDAYFMIMEYIHGVSGAEFLTRSVKAHGRCDLASSIAIVSRIALALDHGHQVWGLDNHAMGIVHHDISPHNIQIGYDGSVKLLDYGVATQLGRHVPTGRRGKFAYMSPESVRKRPSDHRSDLFALATVFYEMVMGRRLFKAKTPELTMRRIRDGVIRAPREVHPEFPEALEKVVMRSLQNDPSARYQTGVDFANALVEYAYHAGLDTSEEALQRHLHVLFADDIADRWNELINLSQVTKERLPQDWSAARSVPATGEFDTVDTEDSASVKQPDSVGRETVGLESFSGGTPSPIKPGPPELIRIEGSFLSGPNLEAQTVIELPVGVNDDDPDWPMAETSDKGRPLLLAVLLAVTLAVGLAWWVGYRSGQTVQHEDLSNPAGEVKSSTSR